MKKIVDPSKLLPAAKSAAVTRGKKAAIKPNSALVTRPKKDSAIIKAPEKSNAIVKSPQKSVALVRKENKSVEYVNVRMIAIENLFRNDFANVKKEAEEKRQKEEKQDFAEAEKKLETPKTKKLGLGGKDGDSPSIGFFDRVKRFLFFTALGWLLPKILEFLPKLQSVVKTIGTIYKFAEGLFGKLFDGFMTLVKFGGDLKKSTLGFIAGMKGGDYQTEFTKLEKTFDTFVNASIIAGVLAADIGWAAVDEFNKWRDKNKPSKGKKEPPAKPSRDGKERVTQGSGGKAVSKGAASRVTQGKGGKAPGWWQKLTGGLKSKLEKAAGKLAKPFGKFASAAVPGFGAAAGYFDAKARAKSGDKLGAFLAGLSAGLDAFATSVAIAGLAAAATGVGLPGAAFLGAAAAAAGTISLSIDAIILIRDLLSITPGINKKYLGYSKGGRVVNAYQGGGTARTTRRPPPKPPKVKKPIKTKPPETKVGRDVGGENKVVQFYAKDTKDGKETTPIFRNFAAALNYFSGSPQNKEQNRPLNALKAVSKILKDLPFGLGYFAGGAIDIALGQSMDVKKGLSQLSSGIAYMVDTLANQRINMSMTGLIRDLNAFADGGTIPATRTLANSYSSVSSSDLIAKVIGPTIEQKVNEAMQSIEKDLRSLHQKSAEEKRREEEERLRRQGGGGGGGAIESIDVGGMSANDVDALGRMIAAEAGGESDLGKAGVLAVILNRYRLIKSGKAAPGQFMVVGKPKEDVTLFDIISAGGTGSGNQFSPYKDGNFQRTSSAAGRAALAAAIRAGGNDPEKFRQNLIGSGLSEADADYVVRSVGFSNAKTRGSRPFSTREVRVGNHSFQQSSDVKLTGTIGRMDASIRESESQVRALSSGFRTGLKTGPAGRIGAGTEYHIDARFMYDLPLRDKISMLDSMAAAHAQEGFVMEFSGSGVAGLRWNPNASQKEKEDLAKRVLASHHANRHPWQAFDYFAVRQDARNRWDKSAQGANIMAPRISGGTYEYKEDGGYGRHLLIRDKNGRVIFKVGHGDRGLPSPREMGKIFKMDELGGSDSSRIRPGERREYDVIIPLDHHTGRLPDKSLWPNASLGAAGREREAQNPTAELMRQRLEAKGLRVKILRPEDYRTEREYNAALVRFSKAGAVVSALHYDAPRSQGGVGFLARLGASPDKADRDFANRLAPILRRMAAESRGDQVYGGIDTAGNITMSKAGPATAALIELGSLVEQERRYGKQFWKNPEFIKHLDALANVTASSVQREQAPPRTPASRGTTPQVQGQITTTRQLGDAIRNLRPGQSVTVPGVGRVSRDKNGRVVYSVDGKGVVPGSKFFGAFDARNRRAQQPPKMQQGGIIKPRGSQLPIPNSYAPYETPAGTITFLIQPYVIEKSSMTTGNRTIAFPVPISLNTSNKNLEALSRG